MKKLLSLALAVVLIICAVPFGAFTFNASAETVTSGTTGDCMWTLGDTKLTISGNGAMADYSNSNRAPWYDKEITEIIIENGVTSIGNWAFVYCNKITSITIPNSVTSIGFRAFWNCYNLAGISIGDNITSIGTQAFFETRYYDHSSNWKNSVLYIGPYLIEAKNSISGEYDIKEGTKVIAGNAFWMCDELEGITIPNSVVGIGSAAFADCDGLVSIIIPNSVKYIGKSAFSSCENLTNITIGDSVASIEDSTFYNCYELTSITIPNSVQSIGNEAFYGCISLKNATIGENVVSIGDSAFESCYELTSIIIPDSVTKIGVSTFAWCNGLVSITIGNGVTDIGDCAFASCTGLTNVIIGSCVVSIGIGAFERCSNLTTLIIPDSVKTIGYSAFERCSKLTSITMGKGVISIGDAAFKSCDSITKIYITDITAWCNIQFATYTSNPLINAEKLYLNGKLVTDLVLPDSVTSIGNYAFYNYSNLISVTLPDSVISIGDYAFYNCVYLVSIKISINITYIGEYAFNNCSSLISILIPNDDTNIGHLAFDNCDKLVIYGYANSDVESYAKENNLPFVEIHSGSLEIIVNETGIYDFTSNDMPYIDLNSRNIVVLNANGVEIKFNENKNGWPLVAGQCYSIILNVEYNITLTLKCDRIMTADTIFPDTSADGWYNDAVTYAVGAGIIGGYGNGKFGTADNIQRQDFVVILARMAGVDLANYQSDRASFADVPSGAYYEKAILWAADCGITTGYNDGTNRFGVGDKVTREQLVTFLYRYAKYQNGGISPEISNNAAEKAAAYPDFAGVTDYAEEAIIWALDKGVISGKGGTHIAPAGNALRCEIAQIMYNIFLNDIF